MESKILPILRRLQNDESFINAALELLSGRKHRKVKQLLRWTLKDIHANFAAVMDNFNDVE